MVGYSSTPSRPGILVSLTRYSAALREVLTCGHDHGLAVKHAATRLVVANLHPFGATESHLNGRWCDRHHATSRQHSAAGGNPTGTATVASSTAWATARRTGLHDLAVRLELGGPSCRAPASRSRSVPRDRHPAGIRGPIIGRLPSSGTAHHASEVAIRRWCQDTGAGTTDSGTGFGQMLIRREVVANRHTPGGEDRRGRQ